MSCEKRTSRFTAVCMLAAALTVFTSTAWAGISFTGAVYPTSPTTWDATTDGTIADTNYGSVTITAGGADDLVCARGRLGLDYSGTMTIDGAGATWSAVYDPTIIYSGELYVSYWDNGTLLVSNGGAVNSKLGCIGFSTYEFSTAEGVATFSNNSTWTNTGDLWIGGNDVAKGEGYEIGGKGVLNILSGSTVSTADAHIARYMDSVGTVTVDGTGGASLWSISNSLFVGYAGTGTLMIHNGGAVQAGVLTQVNHSGTAQGSIVFGPGGGTLTTKCLLTDSSQLSGTGTIVANGLISDVDLTFNSGGATVATLNGSGQDIALNLDMSDSANVSELYIGRVGSAATLTIQNGSTVYSTTGAVGHANSTEAAATVTGAGSQWIADIGINVGGRWLGNTSGTGTLDITAGGNVTSSYCAIGGGNNSAGTVTVSGNSSTLTCDGLLLGCNTDANAVLNVTGGGNVTSGTTTIGDGENSTAVATVSGAGTTWNNSDNLTIGMGGSSTATLNIDTAGEVAVGGATYVGPGTSSTATIAFGTGGGTLATQGLYLQSGSQLTGNGTINARGIVSDMNVTFETGSSKTFNFSGVGLTVNMSDSADAGDLGAGWIGTGTLSVQNGSVVYSGDGYLGVADGAAGTATVSGAGSTWANSGNLYVGYGESSTGLLNINSATVSVSGTTHVGYGANSTGTIAFSGGTLNTRGLHAMSSQLSGTGVINANGLVSDVGLTFDGSASLSTTVNSTINVNLNAGNAATASDIGANSLVIQNGATVYSANGYVGLNSAGLATVTDAVWINSGTVTIGYADDPAGLGTLNITNGTVAAKRFYKATGGKDEPKGEGYINLDNGTLRAMSDANSYLIDMDGVYIKSGGATIDTQGYNITIHQELLTHGVSTGGGLTKTGSGVLTLNGANTYTGNTNVNGGVLVASGTSSLADYTTSGKIIVQSGAAVGGYVGTGGWSEAQIATLRNNVNWTNGASLAIDTGYLNHYTFAAQLVNPTGKSIGLTKLGASTLTLGTASTYTGPTTIKGGVLKLGGNDYLSPTTTVTLDNSGSYRIGIFTPAALDLDGHNQTIASLSGGGSIGGNVYLGAGVLTVGNTTSTSNTTFAGAITGDGGSLVHGGGSLTLTGVNTYTGLTTVQAGVLTLGEDAQAVVLTGGGADIQRGKMVFDYTGSAPDIGSLLAISYGTGGTGAWTTGQFLCTTADGNHGLGWVDDGVDEVTVMYTLYGDSNCDGSVNGTDLNAVLSYYNQSGQVWACGDFNYDGSVNGTDLNTVLSNYNQSLSSSTSAVPEPSTLLLAAMALLGLLAWRKRSKI